jgi:pimeloyl-ACP methyl ester carboxylesterase
MQFYQTYFQTPGVAEKEFEADPRRTLRMFLYSLSGGIPKEHKWKYIFSLNQKALDGCTDPKQLPKWLAEEDLDYFTKEFTRTGFRGGLNWYRNIDRNWELLAPFSNARVTVPALYVAGDRDLVVAFRGMDQLIPNLSKFVPNLRTTLMLSGCGHGTQQERPQEVNAAMIDFLRTL